MAGGKIEDFFSLSPYLEGADPLYLRCKSVCRVYRSSAEEAC